MQAANSGGRLMRGVVEVRLLNVVGRSTTKQGFNLRTTMVSGYILIPEKENFKTIKYHSAMIADFTIYKRRFTSPRLIVYSCIYPAIYANIILIHTPVSNHPDIISSLAYRCPDFNTC